ncbi:MAG: GTP pyrophosphokinase [Actinomycetota bacterium]
MAELEALRQRYIEERPNYAELAEHVTNLLIKETRSRAISCDVDGRAKEVASFVKKALRKGYASPWDEIRDKAGVRAVCVYEQGVEDIARIVQELFHVHHHEDKRATIEPNKLDYLGVHFEVSVPKELLRDKISLEGLICEIQVHTRAQNLWATVSHELVYKAAQEPPHSVKRSIFRLMALLELFDREVDRGREQLMKQPGFEEAIMLVELERHFYSLTATEGDAQLSRHVVAILKPLLERPELENFGRQLGDFVSEHRGKLEAIFGDYLEDDRNPLTSQPESLLIFERLEHDKFKLAEIWAGQLPHSLLESLAEIWGTSIDL